MAQDFYSNVFGSAGAGTMEPERKVGIAERPPDESHPDGIEINENGRKVLEKRYLKKDAEGRPVETVEEMFMRVASNIAEAD
ncbi:MAG: ribonucleotide reductase N-terminal alpha domain-containing protein, partial [Thermodesulfobacteriota bacterium]